MATAATSQPLSPYDRQIQEAEERRLAALREREAAAAEEKAKREQLERLQAEIRQAEQSQRDAEIEARKSDEARQAAELRKLAEEPVRLTDARMIAQQLLQAFEDFRDNKNGGRNVRTLWSAIDAARFRLMTPDVEDRAKETVMAIESLIMACYFWQDSHFHSREEALRQPAGATAPPDDFRIERVARELIDVLNGVPPKEVDFGQMIAAENSTTEVIAKTLYLVDGNGKAQLGTLGLILNQVMERAGVTMTQRTFVRRSGSLDLDDAWAKRQQQVNDELAAETAAARR